MALMTLPLLIAALRAHFPWIGNKTVAFTVWLEGDQGLKEKFFNDEDKKLKGNIVISKELLNIFHSVFL